MERESTLTTCYIQHERAGGRDWVRGAGGWVGGRGSEGWCHTGWGTPGDKTVSCPDVPLASVRKTGSQ